MPGSNPFPSIPSPGSSPQEMLTTIEALRQTVNLLIVQNQTNADATSKVTGLTNRVASLEATLKRNNIT